MSEYPEHDKLTQVREQSQAIGEFLEWLEGRGVNLCRYQDEFETRDVYVHRDTGERKARLREPEGVEALRWLPTGETKDVKVGEGFHIVTERMENLLAEFFGIDQAKLDTEKRQMLAELRQMAGTAT